MKKHILTGILSLFVMFAAMVTAQQPAKESADGEGTLVNEDGSQSEFSFNVKRNLNGKVTGKAIIRNPSYKSENGQTDRVKIDVSCLKVVGKVTIFGGTTKRKNNQAKSEAVYFAVEDKGTGGGIFRGFYFDDDPATEGDAQRCQTLEPGVAVFEPIVSGKIKVKNN